MDITELERRLQEPFGNILLRSAKESDVTLINEFFDSLDGESRALFNRRDYNRRGILRWCQNGDSTREYWLAEQDGRMAGYVFFLDFTTSIPQLGIAVRVDLAGRPLGRQLVGFATSRAKDAGKGGIQLTTHVANVRAQSLYEAMGFTMVGTCKNGSEFFYLLRF